MPNTKQHSPSLLLRVNNSNQLESGCSASYLFDQQGGYIGSGTQCLWQIQDTKQQISTEHFTLVWRDNAFCLHPLNKSLLINRAPVDDSMGFVRLQQGDEITLGTLILKAFISLDGKVIQDPLQISPESLVTHNSNPLDTLLDSPQSGVKAKHVVVLEPTVANSWSKDPLHALQNETLTQPKNAHVMPASTADDLLRNDTLFTTSESNPLSDNAKDRAMDQDFIELPQISRNLSQQDENITHPPMSDCYVAATPLMRGLSAPLAIHNSQQANDFLEEVGRTLQSALRGLIALQQQQDALSDKHLRPLEDNPLRLNLDYDTTLNVLFAEGKSAVHLSAPEAVTESLHNLRLHYQANQKAISEALAVMLAAFSPPRLMARFAQYRRSNERTEMDSTWAWDMYCQYYEELTSSRQQGFNKLFNEVYEQAYDRALRLAEQEIQT